MERRHWGFHLHGGNRLLARKSKEVQRKAGQFVSGNPCPFECKRCMAAFTFDYELTRHTEKEPDCDKRSIYQSIEDAMAREKEANACPSTEDCNGLQ